MEKISIGKKDVVWSYAGSFFKLTSNIILLPFMLHFLSDDDLGMWYVFGTIALFVVLLDFGFAPALSRNISYVWCGADSLKKEEIATNITQETNFAEFKKILTTCRCIYLSLSIVAFILLSTLGTWYILSLNATGTKFLLSWIIFGLGVLLNLYYSYFTSFLRGVGAIAENNIAGVISKLIQIIVTCILLYSGWGILGVSIGYFISGFALRIYSIRAFYNYSNIGSNLHKVKEKTKLTYIWDMFLIIWHNASREGLIMISNYLTSQANTLICSSVLGLSTTGSYGLSVQLATAICGIASIPYATYQPKILERIMNNDIEGSLRIFSCSINVFVLVYFLLSVCAILTVPIILLLKPNYNIDVSMLVALLIFMMIDKTYHLFTSYISNYNKLPYTKAFVISSLGSIILSYMLTVHTNLGVWALILAPMVIAILYNFWKWPTYVFELTKSNYKEFFKFGFYELSNLKIKINNGEK